MEQQHKQHGPKLPISEEIHSRKYRLQGESFREAMSRIAGALEDDTEHFQAYRSILLEQKFLPAGRVQSAMGSPRKVTAFNCFVSRTIDDSMDGIMLAATEAATTMRMGGGIGYDFSTLRPRGATIITLDSKSSGPIPFMQIFDSVCKTVASAGQRRGAQMGVMRVDHPDIEEFIESKCNDHNFTQFNLSVGVTDAFMQAVESGSEFELTFKGVVYNRVDARALWEKLMRATWDWAEPGILFIDRINKMNNLHYCENIAATNPCGEQPLPPHGACLLGSWNLVKYLSGDYVNGYKFEWDQFIQDIPTVVRAQDNIIDRTIYPLEQQRVEAIAKRRMGIGYTGLANTGEALGFSYGSPAFLDFQTKVAKTLVNETYRASTLLAKEKGCFPLFEDAYLDGEFIKQLDEDVRTLIMEHGIRNSHLISIAPTGTISLTADNVSSGCEPVFSHFYDRTVLNDDGVAVVERVSDYGYRVLGVKGKTADECTVDEHLAVLVNASKWVDSAVSKTLNVGAYVSWDDFKNIYMHAWKAGCRGCTTFRAAGKRYGVLNKVDESEGGACYIDVATGKKTCE